MNEASNDVKIVDYNGVCPLCGSADGMVQKGPGGRFRVICRNFNCRGYYWRAPKEGYPRIEDTTAPFDSDLLSQGCTVERYLRGPKEGD